MTKVRSASARGKPYLDGDFADQWRPVWTQQRDNPIWCTPNTDQGVEILDDGSIRAVCIDEQFRIWGMQTLREPRGGASGGWDGFVDLAGERFPAYTSIERFDSIQNRVVKVAAIRALTPKGWTPKEDGDAASG